MFYHQKLMLSFIEEDNPERIYFHALPLLTDEGACIEDAGREFPDNGFLRIVPDKNERFTFKDRMRSLGKLCLIDLASFPPHTNKIRPNRNYQPEDGENHQFIVYSDAVKALPSEMIYQVVTAEKGQKVDDCLTPLCYLRDGGYIEGPFDPSTGKGHGNISSLPPDSGRLFTVGLPTGEEALFFWPIAQSKDIQETSTVFVASDEADNVSSTTLNSSNAQEKIEEIARSLPPLPNSIKSEKTPLLMAGLNQQIENTSSKGTPLYPAGNKEKTSNKSRSRLSGIVGRFSRDTRLEALGANTSQKARRTVVRTPIDQYKRALDNIWEAPETRNQAIEYLIQLPSAQNLISSAIATTRQSTAVTAFKQQLEELEADRLSLLMQVEKLQNEDKELTTKIFNLLEVKAKEDIKQLHDQQASLREHCLQLQEEESNLLEERNLLIQDLEKLGGLPYLLAPEQAEEKTIDKITNNLLHHMRSSGFVCNKNDATHLLCLLVLFPTLQLSSTNLSDSLTLAHSLSSALGAAECGPLPKGKLPTYLSGGNGVAFALVEESDLKNVPYTRLIISKEFSPVNSSYEWMQWPIVHYSTKGQEMNLLPFEVPVCLQNIYQLFKEKQLQTLPESAVKLLDQLYDYFLSKGTPVPLLLKDRITKYLKFTSVLFSGGIASSLDYVLSSILVPFARFYQITLDEALQNEEPSTFPLTYQWLNTNI